MNWKRSVLRILLAVLLASPGVSKADQAIPLSIAQLASESHLILQGTVRSKSVQRDPQGRIYTRVELQVAEVWQGRLATKSFNIVHGGGILGEEQTVVGGQAEYEIGEEVVAFLVLNPRGEGVSIGLAQGKFQVWQDPATGEKLAGNRFHGLEEGGATASARDLTRTPPGSDGRLTVADLKRRVQEAAR
jgi:hypothetical protein